MRHRPVAIRRYPSAVCAWACIAAFLLAAVLVLAARAKAQDASGGQMAPPAAAAASDQDERAQGAEAPGERIEEAKKPPLLQDGELDLDAVVDYFEDLYRADSSHSVAEMTVIRPRRERTLRMEMWTQGEEKALVVIQSPPREQGTATLKVGDNLWNYFPRINRTIRIPPSMMLSSWMGSDLTNDDLVRETSYDEDYRYELVGRSQDPPGWRVRFTAKEGVVGLWDRFELVVSEDGRLPLTSEWYDRKGRLARVMTWDQVRVFDGRRLPAHIVLIPQDQEGHRTEFLYLDIDFGVEVEAGKFSLSNLERKR